MIEVCQKKGDSDVRLRAELNDVLHIELKGVNANWCLSEMLV